MKTKTIGSLIICIIILAPFVFQSCNKESQPNQSPICKITAPADGHQITNGDIVTISVDAVDNDGSITEVIFIIDGTEFDTTNSKPYNYEWITHHERFGQHTIKATTTDNSGKSVSDEIVIDIFNKKGTITDSRDGQKYYTVEMGNQIWFAENLNYKTATSQWYDNNSTNGDIYGSLYFWDDALTACPDGWHLPSDEEWKILEVYLGMAESELDGPGWRGTDEGDKLKSTSGWEIIGNGIDSYGFTAFPGGYSQAPGIFGHLGYNTTWWTATETNSADAWERYLHIQADQISRGDTPKSFGYSVRCLKN